MSKFDLSLKSWFSGARPALNFTLKINATNATGVAPLIPYPTFIDAAIKTGPTPTAVKLHQGLPRPLGNSRAEENNGFFAPLVALGVALLAQDKRVKIASAALGFLGLTACGTEGSEEPSALETASVYEIFPTDSVQINTNLAATTIAGHALVAKEADTAAAWVQFHPEFSGLAIHYKGKTFPVISSDDQTLLEPSVQILNNGKLAVSYIAFDGASAENGTVDGVRVRLAVIDPDTGTIEQSLDAVESQDLQIDLGKTEGDLPLVSRLLKLNNSLIAVSYLGNGKINIRQYSENLEMQGIGTLDIPNANAIDASVLPDNEWLLAVSGTDGFVQVFRMDSISTSQDEPIAKMYTTGSRIAMVSDKRPSGQGGTHKTFIAFGAANYLEATILEYDGSHEEPAEIKAPKYPMGGFSVAFSPNLEYFVTAINSQAQISAQLFSLHGTKLPTGEALHNIPNTIGNFTDVHVAISPRAEGGDVLHFQYLKFDPNATDPAPQLTQKKYTITPTQTR